MFFTIPSHPYFRAAALDRIMRLEIVNWTRTILGWVSFFLIAGLLFTKNSAFLGLTLLILAAYGVAYIWMFFVSQYRNNGLFTIPPEENANQVLEENNWIYCADFSLARILLEVKNHENPEEISKLILSSPAGDFFFERTGINRDIFFKKLHEAFQNPTAITQPHIDKIVKAAYKNAVKNQHQFLGPADILSSLISLNRALQQLFVGFEITPEDFDYISHWLRIEHEHKPKTFLEKLLASPGIGKTWTYAYAPFLDRYTRPIAPSSEEELHIVAHRKKIDDLERALIKSEMSDALIIGTPGVGKETVIKGLAKRVSEGQSFAPLNYNRILKLVMQATMGKNF